MIYVGEKLVTHFNLGTGTRDVYVGNTLVWRSLRATSGSSGTIRMNSNWQDLVKGTVYGYGPATVTVSHTWGASALQWVSAVRGIRLGVNGVLANPNQRTQNYTTNSWSETYVWNNVEFPLLENNLQLQGAATGGNYTSSDVTINSITIVRSI